MKVMYAIHRLEPTRDRHARLPLLRRGAARRAVGARRCASGFPTLERAYERVLPALAEQLDRAAARRLAAAAAAARRASAERGCARGREQLAGEGLDREVRRRAGRVDPHRRRADLHRIQVRERARVWRLSRGSTCCAWRCTRRAPGLLELSWDSDLPALPRRARRDGKLVGARSRGALRGVPGRLHDRQRRGGRDHVPRAPVDPRRARSSCTAAPSRRRRSTSACRQRRARREGRGRCRGSRRAATGVRGERRERLATSTSTTAARGASWRATTIREGTVVRAAPGRR